MHLTGSKANILIDNSGHACLADFSLLTIASDQSVVVVSCIEGGTVQWMSPELLDPERFGLGKSRPTEKSDCYAMGMVIYEVLSGQTPFSQSILSAIIGNVLEGKRPERPEGEEGKLFTDAIWRLLTLCWKHQPSDRANARAILSCLDEDLSSVWSPPDADRLSGVDESWDVRPQASCRETLQDPPSDADSHRSGSCTNLQNTLVSGNTSRRDVGGISSCDPLEQLRRLDGSSPKFHDQVSEILHGEEYKQWVSDIQGDDLVALVNCLDQVHHPVSLVHSPLKPP